jgi:AraC-like DNA-binding protein
MTVNNVGYNHCHDADFYIDRPDGSGDYLLMLLKTDTIFNIDGKDMIVPVNSVFIYPSSTKYCPPFVIKYTPNRTVDLAAHEVRISRSTFHYAYKKHFGISYIKDFINSKISYSKMLLTSTNLTIDDIAKQCGYRSYVHYTRQFKEQVCIIPTKYRI